MVLGWFFCLMIRRRPRSTPSRSSAASDVYKRQGPTPVIGRQRVPPALPFAGVGATGSRHASRLDVERGGDWLRRVGCRCSGLSLAQPQRQWGAAFADTIETRNRVSRRNPVSFLFPAPYFAHARASSVSYTHLRAHETVLDLVCRLLLEKKNESECKQPRRDRIR